MEMLWSWNWIRDDIIVIFKQVRNKVLESRGAVASLILRGVEIVWNLGLYWSTLMYDCFVGRDEEVVPFRARQLRNLLCDLGPSFIKAGQVCASIVFFLFDHTPLFPNYVFSRGSLIVSKKQQTNLFSEVEREQLHFFIF